MTDKEKLLKLKKLADAMYSAANYLTTDASRLHKAMDEYHKFIIHECKEELVSEQNLSNVERIGKNWKEESDLNWKDMSLQEKKDLLALLQKDIEPVSEDLEEAAEDYATTDDVLPNGKVMINFQAEKAFRAGANWQKEQLMKDAVNGCCISNGKEVGSAIQSPIGMIFIEYNKFNVGDNVKIFVIKEE